MNRISIYFGDAEVVISNTPLDCRYAEIDVNASINNLGAKIRKKVETNKYIALITPNPLS